MPDSRLEECGYCYRPTWCDYVKAKDKWQCRACRVVRWYQAVYRFIGMQPTPWQCKVLRDVYGNVSLDDGLRIYRNAYLSMAKKNGKTFVLGGIPLYHLGIEDEEFQPLVVGAASSKSQASLVFNAACALVQGCPSLKQQFRVLDGKKRIIHRRTNNYYQVLAADGDVNDGEGPSVALIDELHRWKNAKHEANRDAILKGTRARREPIVWTITTAGERNECPLWHEEHNYAKQVIRGAIKDPTYYAAIWEADPENLKVDPDFWKTRAARCQANPSHEDHEGGFIKDKELEADLRKAVEVPNEKRKYLRFTLNVESESESRFIPQHDWDKGAVPLRSLVGRKCYVGVDIGCLSDMTAAVYVFPADDGSFDVLPYFWAPKESLAQLEHETRAPYRRWADGPKPLLLTEDSFAVNPVSVGRHIAMTRELFDVQEVLYDPNQAKEMVRYLIDEHGITCVPIPQNFSTLSEATKRVAMLCREGKIRHEGNEILDWHCDSASVRANQKEEIMLKKPDRLRERKRMDGMSALIDAFTRIINLQNVGDMVSFL